MTKSEFISRLNNRLLGIPDVERREAIDYYLNYFEDAGVENEEKVIKELESPEKVAEQIIAEYRYNNQQAGTSYQGHGNQSNGKGVVESGKTFWEEHKALAIVIILFVAIATAPIWSGLLVGIIGLLAGCLGILVGIAAVGIAGIAGGGAMMIVGILQFWNTGVAVVMVGIGLIFITVGLLAILATVWIVGKLIPWIVNQISGLFHRNKGNKEGVQNEKVH